MPKPRQIQELKFLGFRKGLMPSPSPNSGLDGFIRSKNLYNFLVPEKLTARNNYQLKYQSPIGTIPELNNEEFIDFDNYFDRKFDEGAEITLYLTRATVTSQYSDLTLTTLQVYARPFYNGSYWRDAWENLTRLFITKIDSIQTIGALKYVVIKGNYGDKAQWRIINYSKNKTKPLAILHSYNSGNNTFVLVNNQYVLDNWSVNDNIILMRDYIPLRTLQANAEAIMDEVDFVRATNKMIIGFGGDKDRRALVIEYVNQYLYMNTSPFSLNQVQDLSFRQTNRLVIEQCVTDYSLVKFSYIKGTGNLTAGDYSAIGVINNLGYELQKNNEDKLTLVDNDSVLFQPFVDLGLLSRRTTRIELFFNHDKLNHYLAYDWDIAGTDKNIVNWKTFLTEHIYLEQSIAPTSNEYHIEDCATSQANSNSYGSWLKNDSFLPTLGSDAGDYYVESDLIFLVTQLPNQGIHLGNLVYPVGNLKSNLIGKFTITIKYMVVKSGATTFTAEFLAKDDSGNIATLKYLSGNQNQWITETFEYDFGTSQTWQNLAIAIFDSQVTTQRSSYKIRIAELKIIKTQNIYLDKNSTYREELSTRLGYIGDLVKDFGVSHVRSGFVYVSQAYINEKYRATVFRNAINSDGANMQTIIPAENSYQIDSNFGQNIIGINSTVNSNLVVLTESTVNILDPDSGATVERLVGYGLKSKHSLVSIRGSLYFASDNDLIRISPTTGYQPQAITMLALRKQYNDLKLKNKIRGCFDRYSVYRIRTEPDDNFDYKELLYHEEFGFNEAEREHHPVKFVNGMFGFVWFVAEDFNIYSEPFNLEDIIGYADVYGDYRSGW